MSQPKWKLIAQLGDANPLEYGGYFIYQDETGVYVEEGEVLLTPDEEDGEHIVSRFSLEKCTFINGILSDNKFHPDKPAWFAKPESERKERPQDTTYLSNVAEFVGLDYDDFVESFCSDDSRARALAYQAVGEYHGFANLDSDPLTLTRSEAFDRYADDIIQLKKDGGR